MVAEEGRAGLEALPGFGRSLAYTIEGLVREGNLHPVQEVFIKEGAMQCGYCVPGMVLATVALLKRNPSPTRSQIVEALIEDFSAAVDFLGTGGGQSLQ